MAGPGSEIEISVRLLPYMPIRGKWLARIVEFAWLKRFRDEQVRGPFRMFVHTHSFEPEVCDGQQGTWVRDHVEYEVGFGRFGTVADVLLVRRLLSQMFAYRHAATERELMG
jgi:ligand-binding SRPBCC domain-containing protein